MLRIVGGSLRGKRGLKATWGVVGRPLHNAEKKSGSSMVDKTVRVVNDSFARFPRETIGSMLLMEIVSIYGTHKLLVMAGVHVPAEFAVAFAMGRPLRRFRLPLELLGAGALCKVFPQLRNIDMTAAISGAAPAFVRDKFRQNETLRKGGEKLGSIINKYGAAYFISARWVGVSIVFVMYGGIMYGFDVSGVLAKYGIEEYGSVLGTWAAAVTSSAALYPVSIGVGALLARPIGLVTRRFY